MADGPGDWSGGRVTIWGVVKRSIYCDRCGGIAEHHPDCPDNSIMPSVQRHADRIDKLDSAFLDEQAKKLAATRQAEPDR